MWFLVKSMEKYEAPLIHFRLDEQTQFHYKLFETTLQVFSANQTQAYKSLLKYHKWVYQCIVPKGTCVALIKFKDLIVVKELMQ